VENDPDRHDLGGVAARTENATTDPIADPVRVGPLDLDDAGSGDAPKLPCELFPVFPGEPETGEERCLVAPLRMAVREQVGEQLARIDEGARSAAGSFASSLDLRLFTA